MKKKETKRYFLVEYLGVIRKEYNTLEEYNETLKIIEKYNNRKTHKYLYGNITCEEVDGKYKVIIHMYNKLTDRMEISNIDHFTEEFEEPDLIEYFKGQTLTKDIEPDINICYFENKNINDIKPGDIHYDRRIKYIPILFKGDKPFLDKEYINKCLISHADNKDYKFFKALASEFSQYKPVASKIEKLYYTVDVCKYQGYNPSYLAYAARELYEALIVERDKNGRIIRLENGEYQISRRRQRDFGFFIRDYGMLDSKRRIPTRYNKQIKEKGTNLNKTQKPKEEQ